MDFLKGIRDIFTPDTIGNIAKQVNDEMNRNIADIKGDPNIKYHKAGTLIWVSKNGKLTCTVFSKKDGVVDFKVYNEADFPPYLSCPLSLLDHAGLGSANIEWRLAVNEYHSKINAKIKKGGTYRVVGNPRVNHVYVERITPTNVWGKFGPNDVTVSKLQLAGPYLTEGFKKAASIEEVTPITLGATANDNP